ncbi:MAG: hypothetical protein GYB68_02790 [Chloroflexi bacterium]|nr:hypothetical protein [Chloroflexota bacterium]
MNWLAPVFPTPFMERLLHLPPNSLEHSARWLVGRRYSSDIVRNALILAGTLPVTFLLLPLVLAVAWLLPIVVAVRSATRSWTHSHSSEFPLLRLTGLSADQIGRSYALATIYPLRDLIAWTISLAVAMLIASVVVVLLAAGYTRMVDMLVSLYFLICFWLLTLPGWLLLASSLGVRLGKPASERVTAGIVAGAATGLLVTLAAGLSIMTLVATVNVRLVALVGTAILLVVYGASWWLLNSDWHIITI